MPTLTCNVPAHSTHTSTPSLPPQPVKTSDADEKKGYVMKELFETERSFLTVLHLISQEFFNALCELINAEDVQLIFSTAKVCAISLVYKSVIKVIQALPVLFYTVGKGSS